MNYETVREFYNQLEDEESRYIFESRIEYLFTGDRNYLHRMTENVNRLFHPAKIVRNIRYLLNHSNDYPHGVIIYGVGTMLKPCFDLLTAANIKIRACCDKSYKKWMNGIFGLPVISPDELVISTEYRHCAIAISTVLYHKEISDFLIYGGYSSDYIFMMQGQYNFTNYVYLGSYFDQPFFMPTDNEVFIDAGCFDGNTIRQFCNFSCGKYKKIIGFEPHPSNFQLTMKNIDKWGLRDTEIIQKGVWSSPGEYSFELEHGTGAEGARVMDDGDIIINTTTIDEVVKDTPQVTFIKMDVEGAELEALKGAKNTILNYKPKLAICLYHKPEDIIEIPEFLYKLAPDYRYYIRHHNSIQNFRDIALDTVLYAVHSS